MNTNRDSSESFRNFKQRFEAQVAKFNFHSSLGSYMFPDSLVAVMLMANAIVDGMERISILAAATRRDSTLSSSFSSSDFLKSLIYEAVSFVVRLCDKPKDAKEHSLHSIIQANSGEMHGVRKSWEKKTLSKEHLADLK